MEAVRQSAPVPGERFAGKYLCERVIGRGGFGVVYLARELESGTEVVIKVLGPEWTRDQQVMDRFDREARQLNALRHPNVVTMFESGRVGDAAYLVMEYLDGETLTNYVQRHGGLTLVQFVPIAAQILKGVAYAHAREMMLRDLKPANIMLCAREGRANFVKLLDFGLAKLLEDDLPITRQHQEVLGTAGFLSPEQIRGEAEDLRVDVFALGVMFFFMLSGKMPFDADNQAALLYKTIHEAPSTVDTVARDRGNLPEALVHLISECLEKDREDRPHDASAIVERLIDAVPASMFRLPRVDGASSPSRRFDRGSTSFHEMSGLISRGDPPSSRRWLPLPDTPGAPEAAEAPMPPLAPRSQTLPPNAHAQPQSATHALASGEASSGSIAPQAVLEAPSTPHVVVDLGAASTFSDPTASQTGVAGYYTGRSNRAYLAGGVGVVALVALLIGWRLGASEASPAPSPEVTPGSLAIVAAEDEPSPTREPLAVGDELEPEIVVAALERKPEIPREPSDDELRGALASAGAATEPCMAYGDALTAIEGRGVEVFKDTLAAVAAPSECPELDVRRRSLLGEPPSEAAKVDEPAIPVVPRPRPSAPKPSRPRDVAAVEAPAPPSRPEPEPSRAPATSNRDASAPVARAIDDDLMRGI